MSTSGGTDFTKLAAGVQQLDRDTWQRIEGVIKGALGKTKRVLLYAGEKEYVKAYKEKKLAGAGPEGPNEAEDSLISSWTVLSLFNCFPMGSIL